MPRPEAAHRVKSYSAATGFVYQYYFYEVEKSKRGAAAGTEYVYMASVDRKHVFPVRIFVEQDRAGKWSARTGGNSPERKNTRSPRCACFRRLTKWKGFPRRLPTSWSMSRTSMHSCRNWICEPRNAREALPFAKWALKEGSARSAPLGRGYILIGLTAAFQAVLGQIPIFHRLCQVDKFVIMPIAENAYPAAGTIHQFL